MSAEDLAREFAALNTAMRKSHALLADMRDERKLLAQMLIDLRTTTTTSVGEIIAAEVTEQVDRLGKETDKAIRSSIRKVGTLFDEYVARCLGLDAETKAAGQDSIPEMIAKVRASGSSSQVRKAVRATLKENAERYDIDNPGLENTFDPAEDYRS